MTQTYTIGLISDTHGILKPEVLRAFQNVRAIIHAGDIGKSDVYETLKSLAPVYAVQGNTDCTRWGNILPVTEIVELPPHRFYVLHNLEELDLNPRAAGITAVIHGHEHIPYQKTHDSVLYINPGSAAGFRCKQGSVALLTVADIALSVEFIFFDK